MDWSAEYSFLQANIGLFGLFFLISVPVFVSDGAYYMGGLQKLPRETVGLADVGRNVLLTDMGIIEVHRIMHRLLLTNIQPSNQTGDDKDILLNYTDTLLCQYLSFRRKFYRLGLSHLVKRNKWNRLAVSLCTLLTECTFCQLICTLGFVFHNVCFLGNN